MARLFALAMVVGLYCGFAVAQASSAHDRPQVFGLLMGASDYQSAGDVILADLPGAATDIVLMRDALHARGALLENLYVHSDAWQRGGQQRAVTRAAFNDSIAEITARARSGDLVVVHLSGHGLQIPDIGLRDETDGFDEAFVLPTYRGDSQSGEAGLLVDDDIDIALKGLMETGAHVLFIADFCHAGGSARADGQSYGAGVTLSASGRPADIDPAITAGNGGFTAVFASPADRAALQSSGPVWAPRADRVNGSVLSIYAATAIGNTDVQTFQGLQTEILTGYAAHRNAIPGMQQLLAPPRFEGISPSSIPAIHRSDMVRNARLVFDKPANDGALRDFTFAYGALTGVRPGDQFALYDPRPENSERELARFEIVSASATASLARPLDRQTGAMTDTVALTTQAGRALTQPMRLSVARIGQPASDLSASEFLSIAHDLNRLRLEEDNAGAFTIPLTFTRVPGRADAHGNGCTPAGGIDDPSAQLLTLHGDELVLSACDALWVRVGNGDMQARDVSVLIVEPTGQIAPLALFPAHNANRINPGETRLAGYQFDSTRDEISARIAVIAVDVPEDAFEIISFDHLCRTPLGETTGVCPGHGASSRPAVNRGDGMAFGPRASQVKLLQVQIEVDMEADAGD